MFVFQYNFEGRYDLVRFLKTVQKAGLYANLRVGPYVCAEWNFGYFLCTYFFTFRSCIVYDACARGSRNVKLILMGMCLFYLICSEVFLFG